MKKRTIVEIADRVGVSPATVSRALNRAPGVSEDKRRQILAVASELEYYPNAIARSLQGQRTNTIAYIADIGNRSAADLFFFKDFITVLANTCGHHGLDLLIHPAMMGDPRMGDIGKLLRSGRVDGLILADVQQNDQRVRYLLDQQACFATFGRCDIDEHTASVDVDGEWGIYTVTSHLITRGHRNIAFLGLPPEYCCATHRRDGYYRALCEHDLPFNPAYVTAGLTNETEARAAVERLLALPEPPTAFVAASDMLAIYTMSVATQHGLRASRDYAVTGFDDLPLAAHTDPPLTTIRQPLAQVCEALIQIVTRRLSSQPGLDHALLQPELVVRASS
jgi:LacI family transcriptional regulator